LLRGGDVLAEKMDQYLKSSPPEIPSDQVTLQVLLILQMGALKYAVGIFTEVTPLLLRSCPPEIPPDQVKLKVLVILIISTRTSKYVVGTYSIWKKLTYS
jgi:hypothetical protein